MNKIKTIRSNVAFKGQWASRNKTHLRSFLKGLQENHFIIHDDVFLVDSARLRTKLDVAGFKEVSADQVIMADDFLMIDDQTPFGTIFREPKNNLVVRLIPEQGITYVKRALEMISNTGSTFIEYQEKIIFAAFIRTFVKPD